MDHSDKSPSIPLFQRGKWMPIPLGCVYRHSHQGGGRGGLSTGRQFPPGPAGGGSFFFAGAGAVSPCFCGGFSPGFFSSLQRSSS